MKQGVQITKRMADRRLGERLGNDLEGNIKLFWKRVQARDEIVKDVNG